MFQKLKITAIIITLTLLISIISYKIYDDMVQTDQQTQTINDYQEDIQNKEESDFQINLQMKSHRKYIQQNKTHEQILPVLLSVQTNDFTQDLDQLNSQRAGIDIIFVIDQSGSMQGEKIQNVKDTLIALLEYLNEKDTISLILFNHSAHSIINEINVSKENKSIIQSIIQNIEANGGTNIQNALKEALKLISNKKSLNQVTSILLLSDGRDTYQFSFFDLQQQLELQTSSQQFTIHSLGYGEDHDERLMSDISSLKGGNFYYVENANQIDEYIMNVLGGLFSVILQDITLEIKILNDNFLLNQYLSGIRISKIYGNDSIMIKEGEHYQIKLPQLIFGVSKDFIFELTIQKSNINQLPILSFESKQIDIISANLQAKSIFTTDSVILNNILTLDVYSAEDNMQNNLNFINQNVDFHLWRVRSAEKLQEAAFFGFEGKHNQAQEGLKDFRKNIEELNQETKKKLKSIIRDIEDGIIYSSKTEFNNGGSKKLLGSAQSNMKQYSQNLDGIDGYSTSIQKQLVQIKQQEKNQQRDL